MAQAKKKTSTKTAAKSTKSTKKSTCSSKKSCSKKSAQKEQSNMFFVVSMTVLATALLVADMFMILS